MTDAFLSLQICNTAW